MIPAQDGTAFHVLGLAELHAEFRAAGLTKEILRNTGQRIRDNTPWLVFFVVAPDGLCYWFAEQETKHYLTLSTTRHLQP